CPVLTEDRPARRLILANVRLWGARETASPLSAHDEHPTQDAETMFDRAAASFFFVADVDRYFRQLQALSRHLELHLTFDGEPMQKGLTEGDAAEGSLAERAEPTLGIGAAQPAPEM